jgi:hypothetical protein
LGIALFCDLVVICTKKLINQTSNIPMKKITLSALTIATLFLASCSEKIQSASKNAVNFPGMTVSRNDYKLSKDVTAEVEVKEFSMLRGFIHTAKTIGEAKNEKRYGMVSGYNLDAASQVAVYRLLDANPSFDYLTNIRVTKTYERKWLVFFNKYNTKVKITAKGITLNTEK